ncbi:MAG: Grx4 family monothiol glutaredoxin [SAR324 cluster bacterium]|nr:Grx4 family monothiol glutaredoxin [SAR324 cluster bacterium]MCZ6647079.1 Grx4 family monothiol glutaredoxin [SAR324 cluster bacterium]MCZ6730402.1 Grx4 family monothiol glutaredoxin [SAR324 cluster bacterium]
MPSFKNIFKVVGQEQAAAPAPSAGGDISARIQQDLDAHKILIFMKGNREMPQCGFSAATVDVFNQLDVPYETRDVLQDPEIREGIKEFSNWPTIPQVYINGKFVGGCDIVLEMHERGELESLAKEAVGG